MSVPTSKMQFPSRHTYNITSLPLMANRKMRDNYAFSSDRI